MIVRHISNILLIFHTLLDIQLLTNYLEEYGGWSAWDKTVGSWDWSKLALSHQWSIPPPRWATEREQMNIELEDKLKEESVVKEERMVKKESVAKGESVGENGGKEENVEVVERNGTGVEERKAGGCEVIKGEGEKNDVKGVVEYHIISFLKRKSSPANLPTTSPAKRTTPPMTASSPNTCPPIKAACFPSTSSLLQEMKSSHPHLSLGCPLLDRALAGGVRRSTLTEVAPYYHYGMLVSFLLSTGGR